MKSWTIVTPVDLRSGLCGVFVLAAGIYFLSMSAEDCCSFISDRISSRDAAISGGQLSVPVGSLSKSILDIDVLKLVHAI